MFILLWLLLLLFMLLFLLLRNKPMNMDLGKKYLGKKIVYENSIIGLDER